MHPIELVFDPPMIAHRGISRYAPENTFAAFIKAKELGLSWVEFDVMMTADDKVVVIHDRTLDRTTNGHGEVAQHTLEEIKQLDAGSWFHPQFKEEKIPTLQQTIHLLNELQLNANIEIKAQEGKEESIVTAVLSEVNFFWDKNKMPPLISSFSLPVLKWVRSFSEESIIGFLMDEWSADWKMICDDIRASAVDVNAKILTPHRVQDIKATKRKLLAYTVNDQQRAKELFSWGVDAVFTDLFF